MTRMVSPEGGSPVPSEGSSENQNLLTKALHAAHEVLAFVGIIEETTIAPPSTSALDHVPDGFSTGPHHQIREHGGK